VPLTWITPRTKQLFNDAHAAGYGHSVEIWDGENLVGGVFGLAIGRVFFTESQFHTARDASKLAFSVLNRHLQHWGFVANDGKHVTRYLADCGMIAISRRRFSELTTKYCAAVRPNHQWKIEQSLLGDDCDSVDGMSMQDLLPAGPDCNFTVEQLLSTKRSPTW
jgi:leucyl/phenylalanyl-tRNA--protein transferase